jgi:hypothetical protein
MSDCRDTRRQLKYRSYLHLCGFRRKTCRCSDWVGQGGGLSESDVETEFKMPVGRGSGSSQPKSGRGRANRRGRCVWRRGVTERREGERRSLGGEEKRKTRWCAER